MSRPVFRRQQAAAYHAAWRAWVRPRMMAVLAAAKLLGADSRLSLDEIRDLHEEWRALDRLLGEIAATRGRHAVDAARRADRYLAALDDACARIPVADRR